MPARPSTHLPSVAMRLCAAGLVAAALIPSLTLQAAPPPGPSQPTNSPPVAHDDVMAAFTNEDYQALYVLDNDTDADSDPLYVQSNTPAQHGSAASLFGQVVYYKPNANFTGTDTFSYTVSDGQGNFDSATVTVNVGDTGTATTRFAVYAGPDDRSYWTVNPKAGATAPGGSGSCNNGPGLGVQDALVQLPLERMDEFNNGLTIWVNNQQFAPPGPMLVTHHRLVTGPRVMGNVRVTVIYDGLLGSDTLRTRVQFANVSGSTQVISTTLSSNLGTDARTIITGTSSGDKLFKANDRWVVTTDNATDPFELVNTHVLFGPGAVVTPTAVYSTSFACNEDPTPDTHGIRADFHLTIPDGATQELLFFNQAHEDNATALADAAAFNQEPVGFLQGMSNDELTEVVNWKLLPVSYLFLPLLRR